MKSGIQIVLGVLAVLSLTACGGDKKSSGSGSKSKPVFLPDGFYVANNCERVTSTWTDSQGNPKSEVTYERELWAVRDKTMYNGADIYDNPDCSSQKVETEFYWAPYQIKGTKNGFSASQSDPSMGSKIHIQFEVVKLGSDSYFLGHIKYNIDGENYEDDFRYSDLRRMASGKVSDADIDFLKSSYGIELSREEIKVGAQGQIDDRVHTRISGAGVSAYEEELAHILEGEDFDESNTGVDDSGNEESGELNQAL